jgi:hypothetical protein
VPELTSRLITGLPPTVVFWVAGDTLTRPTVVDTTGVGVGGTTVAVLVAVLAGVVTTGVAVLEGVVTTGVAVAPVLMVIVPPTPVGFPTLA